MIKEINNKTITQLIPFVGDNFIEFPLWGQGHWIPQITFWQNFDNEKQINLFFDYLKKICGLAYKYDFERKSETTSNIFDIYITPSYTISETSKLKYYWVNWTLEEMIHLAIASIKYGKELA